MRRDDLKNLRKNIDAIAVFRSFLSEPVIKKLCEYLDNPSIFGYGDFVSTLYESGFTSLGKYILFLCENSENVCAKMSSKGGKIPDTLQYSLASELDILQNIAEITAKELQVLLDWDGFLPDFDYDKVNIKNDYMHRIDSINRCGYGIFANHCMFSLDITGIIIPVRYPDKTTLADLIDYEEERMAVIENTRSLIDGKPAANILLTGDAGTGKSSTIKAVVNELYADGIRIIEVQKEQFRFIPNLLDELASNPLKFILFIDDLSFVENDDNFNALKAALEGSVYAKPHNVVIYATSNRRHVVKERFSDRDGDDIHCNDTIQEIVSLSERFGLHITFQKPDKATYLHIVRELAQQNCIEIPTEELDAKAEQAALRRGGRSARIARHFIDELLALER